MSPPQPIRITLLLLLGDATTARERGDVLWLALDEVRRLFTRDGAPTTFDIRLTDGRLAAVRPEIRMLLLAPTAVPHVAPEYWLAGGGERASAVIRQTLNDVAGSRGGVDHGVLARSVQAQLRLDERESLVIVTDYPITPSPNWRYAIWQPVAGGAVLSTAALDPEYWGRTALGETDLDRLRVLKLALGPPSPRSSVRSLASIGVTTPPASCLETSTPSPAWTACSTSAQSTTSRSSPAVGLLRRTIHASRR